jgi:hypothetical protein
MTLAGGAMRIRTAVDIGALSHSASGKAGLIVRAAQSSLKSILGIGIGIAIAIGHRKPKTDSRFPIPNLMPLYRCNMFDASG